MLLAGLATEADTDEAALAEAFLRASEPPEHDRWDRTEELSATYARGALKRISDFRGAMDSALRGIVAQRSTPGGRGPEILRGLLRLGSASSVAVRAEGHPIVRHVEGKVEESGAWSVRVTLRVPVRDDSWWLTPVARFDVRSGSRPALKWAELSPVESCRVIGDTLVVDPQANNAVFAGVTVPAGHPVTAALTGLTVDVRRAKEITA